MPHPINQFVPLHFLLVQTQLATGFSLLSEHEEAWGDVWCSGQNGAAKRIVKKRRRFARHMSCIGLLWSLVESLADLNWSDYSIQTHCNAISVVYIHVPVLLHKMESIFELHFSQNCSLWAENSSQIGLQVKKMGEKLCLSHLHVAVKTDINSILKTVS